MVRLSSEGLIKTLPNKSTIVAPLNIEEFSSYIDALDLVQRVTTRLAARLQTGAQLEHVKQCQLAFSESIAAHDALGMIERNYDFHVAISNASQNRYLSEFNARLLDEGRRYLRLYFRSFDDTLPSELNDEHHRIVDAIEHRDEELAERLAHEPSLQVSERFLSYLSRRQTAGLSVIGPGSNGEYSASDPRRIGISKQVPGGWKALAGGVWSVKMGY